MKTTKTILLITIMMVLSIQTMHAQTYEWQKPMQSTEIFKGNISEKYKAGYKYYSYADNRWIDYTHIYSKEQLYSWLLEDAKKKYGEQIVLREFVSSRNDKDRISDGGFYYSAYTASAKVCVPGSSVEHSKPKIDPLTHALQKSLQNIREGSRLALDQIRVVSGTDKEDFKDKIIEVLLDNGYKVVAKEYLAKLYEEQQAQQSGIYNDGTTVQENNFSAVGYYINVKQTDTSIKVQIINVSTGEYEANTTINY